MTEITETPTFSPEPQWVSDPSDPDHIAYWDGSGYIAELRWDGRDWVEPSDGGSADHGEPQSPPEARSVRVGSSSRPHRIWLLAAAVVAGALGAWFGLARLQAPSDITRTASAAAADMEAGRYVGLCTLALTDQDAKCVRDLGAIPPGAIVYTNLELGSVVTSGNQALATLTGDACVAHARCWSNHESDLVGEQGKSFRGLYASALGSAPSSPFVLPLIEQGGRWYVTGF